MLEGFKDYFSEIELPEPMIERAEQLCAAYAQAIETPRRVFICDFFEPAGARRYTSLWLLTENYIIEAENFVTQQHLDFTHRGSIKYVKFFRSDFAPFDSPKVLPTTTLAVQVRFSSDMHGRFFAAGSNCRHLYDLVRNHLMPR